MAICWKFYQRLGRRIKSSQTGQIGQKNSTNIMGLLNWLWANLDHLKKDDECVIDLNMLLELVEQSVILVGQSHRRRSYFRRQRILTVLFKARRKVKSLLKEEAHCFAPEEEGVNWNQKPHVAPISSISLKPKTPDLLNLNDYQKVHLFVKTFFKETRETFPLAGRLKYFLTNWGKSYK